MLTTFLGKRWTLATAQQTMKSDPRNRNSIKTIVNTSTSHAGYPPFSRTRLRLHPINPLNPQHLPERPLSLSLPQRQTRLQQLPQSLREENPCIGSRSTIMLPRHGLPFKMWILDRLVIEPVRMDPVAEEEGDAGADVAGHLLYVLGGGG